MSNDEIRKENEQKKKKRVQTSLTFKLVTIIRPNKKTSKLNLKQIKC
jgi:hypothetical protein